MLKPHLESIRWVGTEHGWLELLDQRLLPHKEKYLLCKSVPPLVDAIRTLAVRGAPLIGVAAAYGVVLAARSGSYEKRCRDLVQSRPTAVNLAWAVQRVMRASNGDPAAALREARALHQEDRELCDRIGASGAPLVPPNGRIMTICNTGALATAGIGTAFAVFVHARSKRPTVYALETRPRLQGARLTMYELGKAKLRSVLICDGMAASVMRREKIDLVIAGADRIAANGDTANKIGTYMLSVLTKEHGIPFYIAAPYSTFDLSIDSGARIPIEERDSDEVLAPLGLKGLRVLNPAFDVTPASNITAFITDRGVLMPPFEAAIRKAIGVA
jgi:methylthioribose-1-phosphate isomerase